MNTNNIYQFTVEKIDGHQLNLSDYKNKVLLIVNTASECGFTPQLKELTALKNEFADQDFEILSFPSNDFGGQEPLEGDAIATFCENYGVNFPVFEKIRVRGPYADPLYKFFANKKGEWSIQLCSAMEFSQIPDQQIGYSNRFFLPIYKPGFFKN